ncbi:MAG: hypothetical protein R6V84_18140 [Desulfobacterales bacterium]
MELRKFTDKGIERFRSCLRDLAGGSAAEPPRRLLTDPEFSRSVRGGVELEQHQFESRLHLARYLDRILDDLPERPDKLVDDVQLWSWMSLFYFDQVCPADDNGRRKPGRDYRHIPEPGYRAGHRHLLSGAYLVYSVYEWRDELSKLLLHAPLSVESHFHHEITSRQSMITNRGIMEALHILYYDDAHRKPRRGPIMNRDAPGSLYRFINVIQQLDVTYDLYSMSGREIVGLLPNEFSRWLEKQLKRQAQ